MELPQIFCLQYYKSYLQFYLFFTVWKVSKYGVFSSPYIPAFGLNTEIYEENIRILSEYGKTRSRKAPYLNTFHAVFSIQY